MSVPEPVDDRDAELSDAALLEQIRAGVQSAQRALFNRYYSRLIRFARTEMALDLQRVEPPSAVACAALKSVLEGIPLNEFQLDEGKSLWPLLVTITLHKIANRGRTHRPAGLANFEQLADAHAAQSEVELKDLVTKLLEAFSFSEKQRKIVELLLQEYRPGDIAKIVQVSTRTVRRTREEAAKALRRLLG